MTTENIYNRLRAAYGKDFAEEFCEMFNNGAYAKDLRQYCKKCGISFKEVERKLGVQRS